MYFVVFKVIDSKIQPKRSKSESHKVIVSGKMVVEWCSAPEHMPLLALQELLRIGNGSPQYKNLKRLHGLMVNDEASEGNVTSFSKLHPGMLME